MATSHFKSLRELLRDFTPVSIDKSAVLHDGIQPLEDVSGETSPNVTFFIPASGAGSRLFGGLSQRIFAERNLNHPEVVTFFDNLKEFAFYPQLLEVDTIREILSTNQPLSEEDKRTIYHELLYNPCLQFVSIPKILLPIHSYKDKAHDCLEENILFAKQSVPNARFHFTIDRQYEAQIKERLSELDAEISYSFQSAKLKSPTLDKDLNYVFDEHGGVITRPGGHGTLLQNLNAIESEYIVLKNIDNIPHADYTSYGFVTTMVGRLQQTVKQRDALYHTFEADLTSSDFVRQFLEKSCGVKTDSRDKTTLLQLLNRPLRICGMVPAQGGQVGGGPFWIKEDIVSSLQILEEVELDTESKTTFNATHFNPVWIVCYTKDVHGDRYNLHQFAKKERALPISKILNGREIRSIEYPGLWNGQMHHWNTQFVEIDIKAYTPIKSILDLLKPEHRTQN